jgi:3-dehydrosphinganine reductase
MPPDILINNAGFAHPGYFEELPLDIFRKTMDIDYFGTVYATKAAVPMMMERKTGHVVNIASMAAFLGVFGYTPYTPAKFAVRGFSESLRQELKPHGIHVSIVFPTDTDTPQFHYEHQFKPPETLRISGTVRPKTADQMARSVIRGIERRKTYITLGLFPWLLLVLFNGPAGLFHLYCDLLVRKTQRERKAS